MNQITPYNQRFEALDNKSRATHLKFIADFARSILTNFYEKDETPQSKALEIESWQHVLKNCSSDELKSAWASERSRQVGECGRLKFRVVPEMILARIMESRPRPRVVVEDITPNPNRMNPDRMNPDRAQQIIDEVRRAADEKRTKDAVR